MKIYISGPISSLPIAQATANFAALEKQLILAGHTAVNPMTLPHDHDKSWQSYMREDIIALMACDGIIMLDGWKESKGACIEFVLANDLGLRLFNSAGKELGLTIYESVLLKNNIFDNQ